jgi:dihydroxyacetone kinase-like protein
MKKIINAVDQVENQMIEGLVKAYPEYVYRVEGSDVLARAHKKEGKVALVSGGGSGHEPAHAGYVGTGMLDAAVPGAVFTSPTPDQVYEAIQAVATEEGVLLVIKNYTGDVMNFEMAADMARDEGIKVDQVIVGDDVAVDGSLYTVGRRGIAGTVFVHKIAGAKAETGASLEEVKAVAEKVIANVRSMSMAIKPCTVPAAGTPGFELADDEMEIGMGQHGEGGGGVMKMQTANETAKIMVERLVAATKLQSGDRALLIINGSGATTAMELLICYRAAAKVLMGMGISLVDGLATELLTVQEMAGFQMILAKVTPETDALLKAKSNAPYWVCNG